MQATHLDNLIVLILFGVAILFQLLTRAAARSRRRPPDTRRRSISPSQMARPTSQQDQESDEERIRKFLEALGQPTTSKPPPPVAPRTTYQRPNLLPLPTPLPPLKTRPPDFPAETEPSRPVIPRPAARTIRPRRAEAPAFEVHQGPPPLEPITEAEVKTVFQPATPPDAKRLDVATMLRSTAGLRDAIILREIFGPPRSLQPFDLVGTV